MPSPITEAATLDEVPSDGWQIWTGVIDVASHFSISCIECKKDLDCSVNRVTCSNSQCGCSDGNAGDFCSEDKACDELKCIQDRPFCIRARQEKQQHSNFLTTLALTQSSSDRVLTEMTFISRCTFAYSICSIKINQSTVGCTPSFQPANIPPGIAVDRPTLESLVDLSRDPQRPVIASILRYSTSIPLERPDRGVLVGSLRVPTGVVP